MSTEAFWAGRAQRQIARLLNSSDPADVANGSLLDRVVNGTPSMQILEQQYPQLKGDHEIMPDIRDYPLHPGRMAALPPNPKQAYGDKKLPLHRVPPAAVAYAAMGLKDGAVKYGPFNWRDTPVELLTYYAACQRHMMAWFDGEEIDPDSGNPHMAHAIACLAIMVDAITSENAIDNRPKPSPYRMPVAS